VLLNLKSPLNCWESFKCVNTIDDVGFGQRDLIPKILVKLVEKRERGKDG
jgi:hypothetical protein